MEIKGTLAFIIYSVLCSMKRAVCFWLGEMGKSVGVLCKWWVSVEDDLGGLWEGTHKMEVLRRKGGFSVIFGFSRERYSGFKPHWPKKKG
jgi:hypothetical protein